MTPCLRRVAVVLICVVDCVFESIKYRPDFHGQWRRSLAAMHDIVYNLFFLGLATVSFVRAISNRISSGSGDLLNRFLSRSRTPTCLKGPILPKFTRLAFALLQLCDFYIVAGLSNSLLSDRHVRSVTSAGLGSLLRIFLHNSARLNDTPRAITSFTTSNFIGLLYSHVSCIHSPISRTASWGCFLINPIAESSFLDSYMTSFLQSPTPTP